MPDVVTLDIPVILEGDEEMALELIELAKESMAQEATAASARRIARADQLQGDSDRMWSIYATTPNAMTGIGFQTLQKGGGYPDKSGQ